MTIRTSLTHPLPIDSVAAPGGGRIGMTMCPGKWQERAHTGSWQRDMGADLDVVQAWTPAAVVTLMEAEELVRHRVAGIGVAVQVRGIAWHHLPIHDFDIPREPFAAAWRQSGPVLLSTLQAGGKILLHCLGGFGRTGTIAARLLIELGAKPEAAIAAVRAARPGTIETEAQIAYVRGVRPLV